MTTYRPFAIALIHYPVLDKAGSIVTSAITNIDIHDLSRTARTYAATEMFVITPIQAQRELVSAIVGHWQEGSSGQRIPSRKEALSLVRVLSSVEEMLLHFGKRTSVDLWATAARDDAGKVPCFANYHEAQKELQRTDARPVVLLFGTSWGLAPKLVEACDYRLPPIFGTSDYNHLSVRAACAITLDRLFAQDRAV